MLCELYLKIAVKKTPNNINISRDLVDFVTFNGEGKFPVS